jgi:ankyrin repeat protein
VCTGHLYCVAAGTGVCNYFLHLTLLLACSQSGWTPLLYASEKGHVEVARLLLEHKAAVNQATNVGDTALSCATRRDPNVSQTKLDDVVALLKEHGASR